jgi:hypothetical protein
MLGTIDRETWSDWTLNIVYYLDSVEERLSRSGSFQSKLDPDAGGVIDPTGRAIDPGLARSDPPEELVKNKSNLFN